MLHNEIIKKNFSKAAFTYDHYAQIQKQAAWELLSKIDGRQFKKILELGAGTGNYSLLLRDKFPDAKIKAVELCEKMLKIAEEKLKEKDIEFILADAESINLEEKFDLITAHACLQWFSDLEKALIKYKDLLREDGVILFSFFGPLTFFELSVSLSCIFKGLRLQAGGFLKQEELSRILARNFSLVTIEEQRYQETSRGLSELLNKIKYLGIRGNGLAGKVYLSRTFLKHWEETYLNKFGKLIVTYQVFFCQVK